ncbi:unnamed protein product [Effrenium voratum]|uniref:Uncharacterized protein n=1 Tax=Effrenium voratum TaxID=2562239 RepID=A0AA36MWQ2_9DINO|nr:unnamed protein product [Effrenium voratum]CAJ1417600.1 unnamed protein product [Effrenium voratum]
MSTQASFERHKKEAIKHEHKVHVLLKKEADGRDSGELLGDEELRSTPANKVRSAAAQQRLAVREYREAYRLRPRDAETKDRLHSACAVLRRLQALVDGPKRIPMRRFLAHYNLSIRYWDMGEARQAIDEAHKARKELEKHSLPRGCAEHNLLLMMQVYTEFKQEQKKLEDALHRSPEAVGPNYDMGIHFFDKRMLRRAEAQLRLARDRARTGTALQLVEQDMLSLQASADDNPLAPADGKKAVAAQSRGAGRMVQLLQDIEDDLTFISRLKQLWCVEEDSGKADELQETGVRDGLMPQLLPCMHCRYSQDRSACDAWLADLSVRTDICLQAGRHARACLK